MTNRMSTLTKQFLKFLYIPLAVYVINSFVGDFPIYKDLIHANFLVEIFILVPIIVYYLVNLYFILTEELVFKNKKIIDTLFLISLVYFLLGYGIHFTGNEINNFLNGTVEIAYLYDEIIGHIIMYSAIAVISVIFAYLQILNPLENKMEKEEMLYLIGSGIFFGIISGFGIMEGQTPYFGYVLAPIAIVIFIGYIIKRKIDIRKYPLLVYFITELLMMIIFTIIYENVYGGFPQPSEIWT